VALLVFPGSDPAAKLLIASITLGALCAGAFGLSTVAPAAFAYTGMIGLFAMLASVREGTGAYAPLGILLCLYSAITWFSIAWFNGLFNASVINAMEGGEQQELVGILLRDFQENASDWLFETDAEGRLVMVSPRVLERLGIREGDAVGWKVQDMPERMRPEDTKLSVPVAADVARRLMRERQPFASVEMAVEWRAERLWWSISGKPILHRDGTLAGFRGVSPTSPRRSARRRSCATWRTTTA
jgi:PAS domain-containing protein